MSDDPQLLIVGRRGRPPRSGARATERIEFVVTAEERSALSEAAKSQGYVSIAAAIRDACNSFVEDYGERVVFTPSGDRFKR